MCKYENRYSASVSKSDNQWILEEEIADWRKRLEKALLVVINSKRRARNQLPFPNSIIIYLPKGPNANLHLLTLKVWCIKYSVTPEWMIEQLMWLFRSRREPDNGPDQIHLGIAAHVLVGTVARNFIQERLVIDFPNGENRKSLVTPILHELHTCNLDFSLPEAMEEYTNAILKERKRIDKKMKTVTTRRRNYRLV